MKFVRRNIHTILSILVFCSYLLLVYQFSQTHQHREKFFIKNAKHDLVFSFKNAWLETHLEELKKDSTQECFFQKFERILHTKTEAQSFDFVISYKIIDSLTNRILHHGNWSSLSSKRNEKAISLVRFPLTESQLVVFDINLLQSKSFSTVQIPWLRFALILGIFTLLVLWSFQRWYKNHQKNQIKTDYMLGITHEMKSMLTTISLASEFISTNNGSIKEDEYKQIIINETKEMMKLVQQVLNMAVMEKRELNMNYENIEIQSFIEDIILSFRVKQEKYNGHINFINEVAVEKFWADQILLKLALSNIIDNAFKYSKMHPIIDILVTNDNDYYIIKIKDNGIGIAKSNLSKIFKPTYQVKSSITNKLSGVGMGLYFVKQIIKIHKGKIKVNSELNKGSEFCVYIPKYE